MISLLATFFGSGLIRPAPGTWGSLAAVLIGFGIHHIAGDWGFGLALCGVAAVSVPICKAYMERHKTHDPSEIVIDEVVGQWIAMLPVVFVMHDFSTDMILFLLMSFVLFRVFDIFKPSLAGYFDRRNDAVGVVMDDVAAGVFAAILVALALAVWSWI